MSPRRLINSFLSGRYLKNCQPSYTIQADTESDKRDQLVDAIEAKMKSCDISNPAELKDRILASASLEVPLEMCETLTM